MGIALWNVHKHRIQRPRYPGTPKREEYRIIPEIDKSRSLYDQFRPPRYWIYLGASNEALNLLN